MGRLRQTLAGVAGRVRRRPMRAAALSVGVAGVAAVMVIPLSLSSGTGTLSATETGAPTSALLVPLKSVPAPWSALTLDGRPLFLGITVNGTETGTGPHGPVGMATVLATASHLTAGPHRFTVHWTVPTGKGTNLGYEVAGAAYWPRGTKGEPGSEEGSMANVFVHADP